RLFVTDALQMTADKLPMGTDYVFPGDANGDRKADAADLLHLGLGYYATGAPRPFATSAWAPQFAPNWAESTASGVNFKHIDCDGNGVVNDFDRNAIEQHYTPLDTNVLQSANLSAPALWLKFAADTLVVDPNSPGPLTISADVMIGNPQEPVFDLYGLAFALRYPEYVNHNPEVFYSTNSFFGAPNDILLLPKDNYARRQFDMGFSRKFGQTVSGYGSIAKINFSTDFIIIIDVIDRSESTVVPFVVPVQALQAIDAKGNKIELRGAVQDTVWLNVLESTDTRQRLLERRTLVYPNPTALGEFWISTNSLAMETVEVFDALGRLVEQHQPASDFRTRLSTQAWPKGLYTLRIQTDKGTLSKRLLVN
ncbi:MAG: T9SS type A sorting domain-containing protein, partial [Saprospiraceae bacterium]|nr:T9SS type A sorting domain-containing protein [Saprospiraceae bacterium]